MLDPKHIFSWWCGCRDCEIPLFTSVVLGRMVGEISTLCCAYSAQSNSFLLAGKLFLSSASLATICAILTHSPSPWYASKVPSAFDNQAEPGPVCPTTSTFWSLS